MRCAPAVLLLLLIAAGASWTLRTENASESVPDDADAHELDVEDAPAALQGEASSGSRLRPDAPPDVLVAALPKGLPTWGLEGRVQRPGEDGEPWVATRVRATLESPEGEHFALENTTDEEGRYRMGPIDLPPVPRRLRAAVVFVVRAGPDGLDAHGERFHLGFLASRILGTVGEVRWLHVDHVLSPTRERDGRLSTAGGHPVGRVPVKVIGSHSSWVTDLDGRFPFQLREPGGEALQVRIYMQGAFVHDEDDTVPATRVEDVWEARLPAEREAAGRVVDAAGRGVAGVHLVLSTPGWDPNPGVTLPVAGFVPFGTLSRIATRSAADGTFAFPALVKGRHYELWWPNDDEQWVRLDRPVQAADDDLRVVVERHGFEVRLVEAGTGRPAYGASTVGRVSIEDVDAFSRAMRLGDDTPAEAGWIGAPGERFRIEAWAPGHAFTSLEWTMPETPGRHVATVALRPLDPPPTVRIRCVDEVGMPVGPVPLVYERPAQGVWNDFRLTPDGGVQGDHLVLTDLPPGRVRWAVGENLGQPHRGRWRFTLPAEGTFEVPEAGEVEVTLRCPRGGSARLLFPPRLSSGVVPGPLGKLGLVDAAGNATSPWWFAPEPDGGWDFEIIGYGRWTPDGRCYESSALPPGNWVLVIEESEAWEGLRVPLRIAAGEITEVPVDLRRKD